jgi:putative Mn2+ efflux pump MntP
VVQALTVAAFILPLSIDTFVLGAALGSSRLPAQHRLRTSLVLSCFEGGMPVIGFLIGAGLGGVIGPVADFGGAAVLAGVGIWMLRPGGEDAEELEEQRVRRLQAARGWTVVALGLSISVDEFAVGLGAGLLGLPLAVLIVIIIVQAFLAAQLGMRIGARLADEARESAEKVAGGLLVLAAILIVVEKVMGI